MKAKVTLIASLACSVAAVSYGQQMVAGWDFSQYDNFGVSSIDLGSGGAYVDSVNANYSGTSANYPAANSYGTLYYSGAFGSSDIGLNPSPAEGGLEVEPIGAGDLTIGNRSFFGVTGSRNLLISQGQSNANQLGLGFNSGANGKSFVIGIDLGSFPGGNLGSGWSFTFGTVNNSDPNNASSISWEFSTDGSSYTSSGLTTNVTNTASLATVDLSSFAALDGQSSVFFRGTLSGVDGGLTFIDNLGVDATVVPEPSAYAALAGILALAFAANRRRRVK